MSLSYSTNNGIDYTLAKDENLGDFILTQIKMNEYSKYENAPTGEIYKKKLLNMKMKSRNS
jgi:restriction endonuclease Mrr